MKSCIVSSFGVFVAAVFVSSIPQAHAFGKKPAAVQRSGKIAFVNGTPLFQVNQLQRDLSRLDQLELTSVDSEMLRMMQLGGASGRELRSWLEERVQYIVPEDFDFEGAAYASSRDFQYENPDIFPDLDFGEDTSEQQLVRIVMSNLGAALYQAGKNHGVLLGLKLPGVGKVDLTSPRVGVLQIGSALFLPLGDLHDTTTVGHSLDRLGTLFHEARHSDGNGRSLSFGHAVCPLGHDYAGYYACDRNLNGPYTIGARVVAAFAKDCKTCSIEERELLKLDAFDSFSRVIEASSTEWDDRPEGRR